MILILCRHERVDEPGHWNPLFKDVALPNATWFVGVLDGLDMTGIAFDVMAGNEDVYFNSGIRPEQVIEVRSPTGDTLARGPAKDVVAKLFTAGELPWIVEIIE